MEKICTCCKELKDLSCFSKAGRKDALRSNCNSMLLNDIFKAIIKWWKKTWFEAKLKARLTMIEWENQWEAERELEEQNKPIYIEHKIDPELQTGESRKLGGAMELRAPWYNDAIQPKRQNGVQEAPSMDDSL